MAAILEKTEQVGKTGLSRKWRKVVSV
jgi:hypothetical protein